MQREALERAHTTDIVAERYLSLLREAGPETMVAGSEWYSLAIGQVAQLAHTHHAEPLIVAQVVALLSPSTSWVDNVRLAHGALSGDYRGIDGCNGAKVRALLTGECQTWSRAGREYVVSPGALFNSDKVTSFRDALLGDTEAICLDSHMGNAAAGKRSPELVKLMFDERYGGGLRLSIKQAVRQVAYELGLTPRETQATLWCAWRAAHVSAQYDAPVRSK